MAYLSDEDNRILKYYRGLSIFIIVFGHVGGFWFYMPYSQFLLVFNAVFFFISGAVAPFSYEKYSIYSKYLLSRYISLLIPYYLLCIISLIVYLSTKNTLPDFNLINLIKWMTLTQPSILMPFPIGQIWWLRTLLIISIWAPLIYWASKKNIIFVLFVIIACLILATFQFISGGNISLRILNVNFYQAIFYTSFFVFGSLYSTRIKFFKIEWLWIYILLGLILCLFFIIMLHTNINYAVHCFPPDIYYAAGSLFVIGLMLLVKKYMLFIIEKYSIINYILNFFYDHTFSIYLLHTFSIYICEKYFQFILPSDKNIKFAIIKLTFVVLFTMVISIPFTHLSSKLIGFVKKAVK